MLKEGLAGSRVGAHAPPCSQRGAQWASMAAGSKDLASSVMMDWLRRYGRGFLCVTLDFSCARALTAFAWQGLCGDVFPALDQD